MQTPKSGIDKQFDEPVREETVASDIRQLDTFRFR